MKLLKSSNSLMGIFIRKLSDLYTLKLVLGSRIQQLEHVLFGQLSPRVVHRTVDRNQCNCPKLGRRCRDIALKAKQSKTNHGSVVLCAALPEYSSAMEVYKLPVLFGAVNVIGCMLLVFR